MLAPKLVFFDLERVVRELTSQLPEENVLALSSLQLKPSRKNPFLYAARRLSGHRPESSGKISLYHTPASNHCPAFPDNPQPQQIGYFFFESGATTATDDEGVYEAVTFTLKKPLLLRSGEIPSFRRKLYKSAVECHDESTGECYDGDPPQCQDYRQVYRWGPFKGWRQDDFTRQVPIEWFLRADLPMDHPAKSPLLREGVSRR